MSHIMFEIPVRSHTQLKRRVRFSRVAGSAQSLFRSLLSRGSASSRAAARLLARLRARSRGCASYRAAARPLAMRGCASSPCSIASSAYIFCFFFCFSSGSP